MEDIVTTQLTDVPIPEATKLRFQDAKRAEIRTKAATEATELIRQTQTWTAENFKELLDRINTDWYREKIHKNRVGLGLIGKNAVLLAEALDKLNGWFALVRDVAPDRFGDDEVTHLLQEYWSRDIPNPYIFPTSVFAAFAPSRYVLFVNRLVAAVNHLLGGKMFRRKRDANEYLRISKTIRDLCETNGWHLCLADSALHHTGSSDDLKVSRKKHEFVGYTDDAVRFLLELPAHTEDPAWHQSEKDRYHKSLKEPSESLVQALADKYLVTRDPRVAAVNRPLSVLKKNDYGGNTYYPYYWLAFYDPDAESKTRSVQLFFSMNGEDNSYTYGLSVGHYGQRYRDNILQVMQKKPNEFAEFLETLPDNVELRQDFRDGKEQIAKKADVLDLLKQNRLDKLLPDPGQLTALDLRIRESPLAGLVRRGQELADDVGGLFDSLWPLFDAARFGDLVLGAAPRVEEGPDKLEREPDEEAPETLSDLSRATSVPENLLEEIEQALIAKGQVVLLGPPGTSKTYVAQAFARYFTRYQTDVRPQGESHVIYMHANWAYEDFFEGLRPKAGVSGLEFEHRQGAFLNWVEATFKSGNSQARYALVLDEINRCDTAAVLGELLQLMEYRGRTVRLMSGRNFVLPRQLYIIGTMNSADRSIGRMDLALRRRFFFFNLLPNPEILQIWLEAVDGRNPCGFSADALENCNNLLDRTYGIPREQQIGHALFMTGSADDTDEAEPLTSLKVRQVVRYSIIPYVRELLVERGRDPEPAAKEIEGMFSVFWKGKTEEDMDESDV